MDYRLLLPTVGVNTNFSIATAPAFIQPPSLVTFVAGQELVGAEYLGAAEQTIWAYMTAVASGQQRRPIALHRLLVAVARTRAAYIARESYPNHTDKDGKGPQWHCIQAGYTFPDWYSQADDANHIESLAFGLVDNAYGAAADHAWTVWMTSPGHAAHVLGHRVAQPDQPDPMWSLQTHVGIGAAQAADGSWAFVVLSAPPIGTKGYA